MDVIKAFGLDEKDFTHWVQQEVAPCLSIWSGERFPGLKPLVAGLRYSSKMRRAAWLSSKALLEDPLC